MNQDYPRVCPVCKVTVTGDSRVHFSNGNMGTKAQLYARVCRYTRDSGCINQDKAAIGTVMREDGFSSAPQSQNAFEADNCNVAWKLFQT